MMFALCLKIPTIFLEMIICWTTDLPTFSVLPFLLISYQSVVTSWRGILTNVKYIEKWQSIPVALVFCINHYVLTGVPDCLEGTSLDGGWCKLASLLCAFGYTFQDLEVDVLGSSPAVVLLLPLVVLRRCGMLFSGDLAVAHATGRGLVSALPLLGSLGGPPWPLGWGWPPPFPRGSMWRPSADVSVPSSVRCSC